MLSPFLLHLLTTAPYLGVERAAAAARSIPLRCLVDVLLPGRAAACLDTTLRRRNACYPGRMRHILPLVCCIFRYFMPGSSILAVCSGSGSEAAGGCSSPPIFPYCGLGVGCLISAYGMRVNTRWFGPTGDVYQTVRPLLHHHTITFCAAGTSDDIYLGFIISVLSHLALPS